MSGALVAQAINESIGTAGFQGLDAILKEYLGLIAEQAGTARVPISRTINGHSLASDVYLDNNDVGAAPAGYGWGEGRPSLQFNAKNVNKTAVFVSTEDTPTSDSIWLCEFYATSNDGTGNYGHMVATCQGGSAKGSVCVRLKENGVCGEWEWINPPMKVGVEYRTAERWNGKPVYAKLFDCGECGGGVTHIDTGFPSTHRIVRYSAGAVTTFFFASDTAYTTPGNGAYDVWVSMSNPTICVIKKSSATEHIYCTVHYTKD